MLLGMQLSRVFALPQPIKYAGVFGSKLSFSVYDLSANSISDVVLHFLGNNWQLAAKILYILLLSKLKV